MTDPQKPTQITAKQTDNTDTAAKTTPQQTTESGGPAGLEPTRYGDWEKNGRCVDF